MSRTVTPGLAFTIFIIILLIALAVTIITPSYRDFKTSRFHTFVIVLAGFSIIIVFMFYYGISELQVEQSNLTVIEQTNAITNAISEDLMDEIKAATKIIPSFAISLIPLSKCSNSNVPEDTAEACVERRALSYRIFTIWQMFILDRQFINYETNAILTFFLQLANSKPLHKQWLINRLDFNTTTIELGDLLFAYGLHVSPQTPEAYRQAAIDLAADPRFEALF